MSEQDDRYVGNDASRLPRNTGEFRAAPDVSASTAEFKAFAAGQTGAAGRAADSGSWPEQPWDGQVSGGGGGSSRTIAIVVGAVVVVVLIVILALIFA
jgi:hypothetical protein